MHNFFIDSFNLNEDYIILDGDQFHHAKVVLRLVEKDNILITCNKETYLCEIDKIESEKIICKILSKEDINRESNININIYQAIGKGNKMDLIIQKCTELGINKITPILTKRVIVKLSEEKLKNRKERYERISLEASKQSKRQNIPIIGDIISINDIKSKNLNNSVSLVAYENEDFKTTKLKEILKNLDKKNINIFIGPEGGWTEDEILYLKSLGVISVSLGPRILRTETAPIALASILQYELGDIG